MNRARKCHRPCRSGLSKIMTHLVINGRYMSVVCNNEPRPSKEELFCTIEGNNLDQISNFGLASDSSVVLSPTESSSSVFPGSSESDFDFLQVYDDVGVKRYKTKENLGEESTQLDSTAPLETIVCSRDGKSGYETASSEKKEYTKVVQKSHEMEKDVLRPKDKGPLPVSVSSEKGFGDSSKPCTAESIKCSSTNVTSTCENISKKLVCPKTDSPKVDSSKVDTLKVDSSKVDIPKVDTPKVETPKVDTPKSDTPIADTATTDSQIEDGITTEDTPTEDDIPQYRSFLQNHEMNVSLVPRPIPCNCYAESIIQEKWDLTEKYQRLMYELDCQHVSIEKLRQRVYDSDQAIKSTINFRQSMYLVLPPCLIGLHKDSYKHIEHERNMSYLATKVKGILKNYMKTMYKEDEKKLNNAYSDEFQIMFGMLLLMGRIAYVESSRNLLCSVAAGRDFVDAVLWAIKRVNYERTKLGKLMLRFLMFFMFNLSHNYMIRELVQHSEEMLRAIQKYVFDPDKRCRRFAITYCELITKYIPSYYVYKLLVKYVPLYRLKLELDEHDPWKHRAPENLVVIERIFANIKKYFKKFKRRGRLYHYVAPVGTCRTATLGIKKKAKPVVIKCYTTEDGRKMKTKVTHSPEALRRLRRNRIDSYPMTHKYKSPFFPTKESRERARNAMKCKHVKQVEIKY